MARQLQSAHHRPRQAPATGPCAHDSSPGRPSQGSPLGCPVRDPPGVAVLWGAVKKTSALVPQRCAWGGLGFWVSRLTLLQHQLFRGQAWECRTPPPAPAAAQGTPYDFTLVAATSTIDSGLKQRHLFALRSGARSLRSRCGQAALPLRAPGRTFPGLSPALGPQVSLGL